MSRSWDAVVVGAGPNGLSAAISLSQLGGSVLVLEGAGTPGGAVRSEASTLPGFLHDSCSTVHPLGLASPALRRLDLEDSGLRWIHPPLPAAHPLEDGRAAVLHRSADYTAHLLGVDMDAYRQTIGRTSDHWSRIESSVLGPAAWPRDALATLEFARLAVQPASAWIRKRFESQQARALLAGMAGHAQMPFDKRITAGIAILLAGLGHAVGWPFPEGGAQTLIDALVRKLEAAGGELVLGHTVRSVSDLPPARVVLFDLTPAQLLKIAGENLPGSYKRRLRRYRLGCGVFKIDWALDAPIPWEAEACRRAGTVHVGGTLEEVERAEREVAEGLHPNRPFVLVTQPTQFDRTRAPEGKHIGWAYCHVPIRSTVDMTAAIEAQIERYAPGFRDCILHRATRTTQQLERLNPNLVGGDINGGVQDIRQLLTRPVASLNPYKIPGNPWYLCSSSTPPGGGVHGMCGYHAALRAAALMDSRLGSSFPFLLR